MRDSTWDRLQNLEYSVRARKGEPPINALVGSPYINAARQRSAPKNREVDKLDGAVRALNGLADRAAGVRDITGPLALGSVLVPVIGEAEAPALSAITLGASAVNVGARHDRWAD